MNLKPDGRSVLTVGIKDDWPAVVATFLHEAMEAALVGIHCRYDAFPSFSLSSARFRFFHTHEQFAEAVQQAGEFLAKALPDVSAAYRKHRKNHGQA